MISKISYIKLIREDIRHRGWLAALSGVLLFLSMPVYTLIYLDSYSEDPEVLKEFADTFSGFINGYNSAFLIILIGILAFAVGISGFQFMHKKEKLDLPRTCAQTSSVVRNLLFGRTVPLSHPIYSMYCIDDPCRRCKRNYDSFSRRRMFSYNGDGNPRIPSDLSHMYFCGNADRTKRNDVPRNTCHRSLSKPRIDTASVAARCVFPDNL